MSVSKKELKKRAAEIYFAKNEHLEAMLATSDGNFFYPDAAYQARTHADSSPACDGKVHVIERPADMPLASGDGDNKPAAKEYTMNAKDAVKAIRAIETKEALLAWGKENKISEDERKSVVGAWKDAFNKLVPATDLASGEVTDSSGSKATPEQLIEMVNNVTTEEELDALEATHNLSKHENSDVVAAYEAKEESFL